MSTDIFYIPASQYGIHDQLVNWTRWVSPGIRPHVAPGCERAQSNARQWAEPEIKPDIDELAAVAMEHKVRGLPEVNALAIRWWYVHHHRTSYAKMRRQAQLSGEQFRSAVLRGRELLL
jgi:hypothetical protein